MSIGYSIVKAIALVEDSCFRVGAAETRRRRTGSHIGEWLASGLDVNVKDSGPLTLGYKAGCWMTDEGTDGVRPNQGSASEAVWRRSFRNMGQGAFVASGDAQ
jgi:hypothetical protein